MSMRNPMAVAADIAAESSRLEVRLAGGAREIDAAQALRYRVFHEELRATPSGAVPGRDVDGFDAVCDHLVILDHAAAPGGAVVGTYRLLRRSVAERALGFYSATEFDIAPLLAQPGELLELGRSCVDPAYRTRATMQLLWRGISAYVLRHGVSLMFGCASLPGTDVDALAPALSYLHHRHLAPPELRARALPDRYVDMNRAPASCVSHDMAARQFEGQAAVAGLPPLLKGYLRLGGFVGEGAVVDQAFNTTDVCLIVPLDNVAGKYARHFLQRLA
ncbi:GNAT family N-acyltransferase [Azospirillum sp. SYSU D00513]|uniref:GNAT family N-acetyltransferase n=1 Tax=Azospirillum sp. SYSU D00513 TaxID=2812561 RepID=UPI001A9591E0|nr:GNAT family N-acyltransferase [Azospirillum sp. SYSU D00513]